MNLAINFVAFQVGWFAAVLSAAAGNPWIGALVMTAVILLHLLRSERPGPEAAIVGACGLIGGAWDSLLVALGWVSYPSGMLLPYAAPYWIVGMWMLFATTLNVSLGWLKGRDVLAVAFGAAGGPLAYFTGEKLGGIILASPVAALVALGIGWGVMMPLLLRLADRLKDADIDGRPAQGWILD